MYRLLAVAAVAATIAAHPATARTLTFRATLGGAAGPTTTGSPASGKAVVKVDTTTQRVSVELDVTGIMLAQLDDALVAKPIGPVHFHVYRSADDVEMILPLPYGAGYRVTRTGFHLSVRNYPYADGEKLLNSGASFDEFVNALRGQRAVIDVHTDKFPAGEISGRTAAD